MRYLKFYFIFYNINDWICCSSSVSYYDVNYILIIFIICKASGEAPDPTGALPWTMVGTSVPQTQIGRPLISHYTPCHCILDESCTASHVGLLIAIFRKQVVIIVGNILRTTCLFAHLRKFRANIKSEQFYIYHRSGC